MAEPRRKYKGDAPPGGNGKLMCLACEEPLRDHKLATPCPVILVQLQGTRLTAPSRRSARFEVVDV